MFNGWWLKVHGSCRKARSSSLMAHGRENFVKAKQMGVLQTGFWCCKFMRLTTHPSTYRDCCLKSTHLQLCGYAMLPKHTNDKQQYQWRKHQCVLLALCSHLRYTIIGCDCVCAQMNTLRPICFGMFTHREQKQFMNTRLGHNRTNTN